MTESKKKWRKPELVVLMRSRSEEAVLEACKGGVISGIWSWEAHCSHKTCPSACDSLASS